MRVDEHTINLDESPVFYRSGSEAPTTPGAPPLYLHGIPTSSDDWVDFLARTGGIAPDLQGFGRSRKGGHLDYSLAGLTLFLERFLAEIQVESVKLVAHDWGAPVALLLAERHPNRVEALVLFNAPPVVGGGFAFAQPIRLWRRPLIGEVLMGSTNRWLLARTLRQGSVREDAWPDSRVAEVWKQFDQGTQRAILRLVRSSGENSLGGAPTEVPGLIVWGERDPWYPAALAGAYATRIPDAQIERVPDAGHWPWLDRVDLIERVAAFLEQ